MQRAAILILVGIVMTWSMAARGLGLRAAQGPEAPEIGMASAETQECGSLLDVVRRAEQTLGRDGRAPAGGADSVSPPAVESADTQVTQLPQNPRIFVESVTDSDQWASGDRRPNWAPETGGKCAGERFMDFPVTHQDEPARRVPIWRKSGNLAFFYESGMTIDADGAPNAYHPDNIGIDDLLNAGSLDYWPGLAKDENGKPFVQGPDDPFPGYYVSATALYDPTRARNDPSRYLDATKIPFVVLPEGLMEGIGARLGDFAAVFNLQNGKSSYAIFGDTGPSDRIGEGSVALAENLGIRSDARYGGTARGILYLVFPGSGNGRPRPLEVINEEAEALLRAWVSD